MYLSKYYSVNAPEDGHMRIKTYRKVLETVDDITCHKEWDSKQKDDMKAVKLGLFLSAENLKK